MISTCVFVTKQEVAFFVTFLSISTTNMILINSKYDLQLYGCQGAADSPPPQQYHPSGGVILLRLLQLPCLAASPHYRLMMVVFIVTLSLSPGYVLVNQEVIIHCAAVYTTVGLRPLRFVGNGHGWEEGERNISGHQGGFSIWYECKATLKGQADWQCTDF